MTKSLLKAENVCLHIIDVQKSLMSKIFQADKVADTVELMVNCAKILDIPILANTQYKKGLGPYVPNVEAVVADVPTFDKVEFNAIANTETEAFINALPDKVTTIVLVGVEAHICVYQTAMGLLDKNLSVWVVSDGVSSRSESDCLGGIARMRASGVAIGPAEMLIYELLGKAGSPEFKQVLPYILKRN